MLKKIIFLLDKKNSYLGVCIILVSFIAVIFDVFSIVSLVPVGAVVFQTPNVENYKFLEILSDISLKLNFDSFPLFLITLALLLFSLKFFSYILLFFLQTKLGENVQKDLSIRLLNHYVGLKYLL